MRRVDALLLHTSAAVRCSPLVTIPRVDRDVVDAAGPAVARVEQQVARTLLALDEVHGLAVLPGRVVHERLADLVVDEHRQTRAVEGVGAGRAVAVRVALL